MNYSGNIPDWHQYNSVQTNINEVTSTDHNVNANRLAFIPSVSPTSLNALNTEGYKKYQNESSFSSRHFPPANNISNGPNNTDNLPLPSMVQMQGYIGQYNPTINRNSVMDNVKGPMDIRNGSMNTFNDDYRYRNNHMALPGQNSHLNGSNININTPATSIGSRNNSVCAVSSVRQGPASFIPCKALCCNPNTNMSYQQWDKFGTYQSNAPYRENMCLPGYQTENRQYGEHNFRKDNFENKEMLGSIIPSTDPRRNYSEYKYNKDSMMPRGCAPPSGMVQNYPIQNYNYAAECQKYTYPIKEYPKANNIGLQDAAMFKHQEQNYITQQKYSAKQGQYTTGNILPKTVPTSNVTVDMASPTQNSYYATQYMRNMATEFSRPCQKPFESPQQVTAIQSTPGNSSRYHSYQQKIAMQRFSMENHLRELTRIPGYQSHPKYKESVLRYREILKLQQSYGCQTTVQHPLRIPTTSANTVPSINLQFDQNGILINSSCLSDGFPKTQHTLNSIADSKHLEKQGKDYNSTSSNLSHEDNVHSKQSINHSQKEHLSTSYPNNFQNQDQFLIHKSSQKNEFKIQESTDDNLNSTNVDSIATQQKASKEFADKPDLDVRQFLANWDASEDEDDSNSNLPDVVLSNSTPLVVVEYESIDSTSKIPHNMIVKQSISCSKQHEKGTEEYPKSPNSSSHNTESVKSLRECKSKNLTKSENIIHCITNNTDEIPTIHIVDNLQISNILEVSNEQIIETLENQGSITFYEENIRPTEKVTVCENKEDSLAKEIDTCKVPNQYNTESLSKDTYITNDVLSDKSRKSLVQDNNQKLNASEATSESSPDEKAASLQKQSSFTSEESHNTDDISLPDLPTTECTPISTTLNTPIHSDSEEPSGRVSSISSNPIEIIQNSPIISFTHSPIKIGSYDHLDDTAIPKDNTLLQFNLEEVNQSSNNSSNVFENATAPNDFNKSDSVSKSDANEISRSNKSHTNTGTHSTILHIRKMESKELNVKVPDACVVSAPEYESEVVPVEMHKNSIDNSKNIRIEKFNTDKCQSTAHSSKYINNKTPIPIGTSKCVLKNKLNENKHQRIANVDTILNNDKQPEVNIEIKKQAKCLLVTKLQQDIPNDKTVASSTSEENGKEAHTLVRCVEKSTLSDIKNTLSIPNINIYTSNPDKSHNVNTISIPKRCVTMLMSNKLSSKSTQNACTIKENSDLSTDEVLIDRTTHCKTYLTSDSKNNNELITDILNEKQDTNEFMFSQEEEPISSVIAKNVHNELQKNNESCKIDSNVDIKTTSKEKNVKNKIVEEKKFGPSQKEYDVDRINVISAMQQDSEECITTSNTFTSVDKCIDDHRSIKNSGFNIKSASQFVDTRLQQCNSEIDDSRTIEKNADLKCKNDLSRSSSMNGINSTTLEKTESEQLYSISKSFATKNVNPDFEIQVTNVNLKFTDNDICKEIVTLRDKRQENLNNCSDSIKIEINVMCAERNVTEKLLQQDLVNVDSEIEEQPNNNMCGSKSICFSNMKEHNTFPHRKLNMEQENNKVDEVNNCEQSESTNIICNKNVETTGKVQEEPLSLIVRNTILPSCKENPLLQEFPNESDIPSKNMLKRSQNDENGINDNHSEIVRETKFTNISSKVKKQSTSLSSPNKPIKDLKNNSICYVKNNNLQSAMNQENEPSNIIYSSAAFSSSSGNYMQNSTNASSFNEQIPKSSKIKEPFPLSYKCKEKKDDEDDSSCDRNDNTPNIVTIHVKTDNMNNEKFAELDFTNFDLFSNESNKSTDNEPGKWRRPITPVINQTLEECDLYGSTGGYVNPIFTSIEESNNRKEVPVYRTKDGKITYSPNPKALFLENRERAHCTMQGHSSYKYYHHPKMYTSLKKDKDVNNHKEKAPLECNNTKITWSESTVKDFPEFINENDSSQKHSLRMKYQGSMNLKHYHPKIEKQFNNVSDNGVHREYNKQHSYDDDCITYKDYFKSEVDTDKSESRKDNFKNIFDDSMCLKEKNIKRTEMTELPEKYVTCHNAKNNNYIHKHNHNDISSSFKPKNTSLGKINLNETCDIKLKCCDMTKESIVPYAICDEKSDECSLNQSSNLSSKKSNTTIKSDKKEFKPNLDQLKSTELHLEGNHFKDIECDINNIIKHDSSSEVSVYFNERKIDPDMTHVEGDDIQKDLQATSELSKYKRQHEINFSMKCEVHSDENVESFEEDFDNTRDILKYADTENTLITKKDVLLTETLDVECPDSLKQLNSTKQKEELTYNSDENDSDMENTNFSLENEVSKINEDENLNTQIAEAHVFYAESNASISEKEWKRLPSNCFKSDIQIIENDVISSNNLDNEVHVIQEESMHISKTKKTKTSRTVLGTMIDESSFNETSTDGCQNHTFITKHHRYGIPFSEAEIKSQIIRMNQDKDEVILSEPIFCNKNINVTTEINTDKDTEDKSIENTSLVNSTDSSKAESIEKGKNYFVKNNDEVKIGHLSLKKDVEIINESQDCLKTLKQTDKKFKEKQFCDYFSENKINMNSLYSASKQQKDCSIETCNTTGLENISPLISQSTHETTNDKKNGIEEECSLSPPDITTTAYIDVGYSSMSDRDANDKIISRSVIEENEIITKSKPELSPQPKIPKMIIRNTKSRSTTPLAEEILDTSSGFSTFINSKTKHSTFIIENEEPTKGGSDSDSEISSQKYNLNKSKVPKMKIKFNEKSSRKDIEDKNMEISFKRKDLKKTVPKVKIKKIKTEETITQNNETRSPLIVMEAAIPNMSDETKKREKIPKLKLRKNEDIIFSENIRKKPNLKTINTTVKKYKSDKNEIRSSQRYNDSIENNSSMPETEIKNKLLPCISEKIPKVIIKRASASAEFKCEFSESDRNTIINSAKWQPEVKLQRSQLLDNMVKDLKYCQTSKAYIPQTDSNIISSHRTHKSIKSHRFRGKRHGKSNKFYSSSSISDLHLTKYEKRGILDDSASNSKLCDAEASPMFKEIKEHNELPVQAINRYKLERNLPNLNEGCQMGCVSDEFADKSLYKYSRVMHINKDDIIHTIIKSDIANIENNIFKNNADNDLITSNTNFTNNVDEVPLQKQNSFMHCSDNEDKFPEENNESETKLLKSDVTIDDSIENDNSVIKLDSSDESQSTIEILPASPDINQIQIEKHNDDLTNEEGEQLYSEDAIPTQFELELEVTDSNIDSVDMSVVRYEQNSENTSDNKSGAWQLDKKIQNFDDPENYSRNFTVSPIGNDQCMFSYKVPVEESISNEQNVSLSMSILRCDSSQKNHAIETITARENLCCNDLLMKEVLAAKEMLKKCLSMSKNGTTIRNKLELITSADKNQDSSFNSSEYTKIFPKNITSDYVCDTNGENQLKMTNELNQQKLLNKFNLEQSNRKDYDERMKKITKFPKYVENKYIEHTVTDVQRVLSSPQNSPIISLKTLKRLSQSVPNKNISTNIKHSKTSENRNLNLPTQDDHIHQLENKIQNVEIEESTCPKIVTTSDSEDLQSEDNKNCNESRSKEDNMPILEPEISFNHDANSDRDSSRSPPVITNQEVVTTQSEVLKYLQEEVLISKDEKDDNKIQIEKEYDMTVTDIVTQLAYHKKSTIRHKRYCTLCEKWFPTTSRHRRHLAGYQHRHLELTQRRTIHALFILFTGKPCSKLLRTTTMRDDCSIGELTPLQIAVQDLAKCMDETKMDLLIQKNVNS